MKHALGWIWKPVRSRRGFILMTASILLGISGILVGGLMTLVLNYRGMAERQMAREKATFLAEAGLRAAVARLNAYSEGNISYSLSRTLVAQTNHLLAPDWGFQTTLTVTNGRHRLTAVGRYGGQAVVVASDVSLGSGSRSIHALYAHAIYVGNSAGSTNYTLQIGGTGTGADFVRGDVYCGGHLQRTGDALLRLPEEFVHDWNNDGICDPGTDTWHHAYATQYFDRPLTQAEFDAYTNAMAPFRNLFYNNGRYDPGEAFVDTIGNGQYDEGEPFQDLNGNGRWDPGDQFIDRNGNGVYDPGVDTVVNLGNGQWDPGEEWTEDPIRPQRQNGRYDPAGGYWQYSSGQWSWKTTYKSGGKTYSCASWPAEAFEDVGDGVYRPAEPYTDQNGIYDPGEQFFDDRNSLYDYGTQVTGQASGMPAPGPGQRAVTGGDPVVSPPDLPRMYYNVPKTGTPPSDALPRWGHDVAVQASHYGNERCITDPNDPRHIFVRNPPTSGSVTSRGKTIYGRQYSPIYDNQGRRIDDYFLEDPVDPTYNRIPGEEYAIAQNDDNRTHTMMINVTDSGNDKVYYVDGNLYIHHPRVYAMRFRNPGTRITIVARGNIIISDEFYYNASYDPNLQYSEMDSTVVRDPKDMLCLIALRNPNCPTNSGNILIGDKQFGTGGSIHAMLYAENDFIDNNINTVGQQFISVYGNMSAGNQIRLNRAEGGGQYRTRLDITLDERIRNGSLTAPGLPPPVGSERSIQLDTAWRLVPGTWNSWAWLQ
jgi:hypothetical protein